jgi:hypothetical protein
MSKQMLIAACALMLMASPAAAQSGTGTGRGAGTGVGSTGEQATTSSASSQAKPASKDASPVTTVKTDENQANPRFVRSLTNVQIELTLTDQMGAQPAEKKTVSMIASSGNWSKIRSARSVHLPGEQPYVAELNVDARPFVSVDGQVQLEITLEYAPVSVDPKSGPRPRPAGLNQSQTIVLQSGKPLIVSQAADPLNDRKVVVEVKATVLK